MQVLQERNPYPSRKLTIGLDVDDVLCDTVPVFLKLYTEDSGIDVTKVPVHSHNLTRVFPVSVEYVLDTYKKIWEEYYRSIPPTEPNLSDKVIRLKSFGKIVILTNNPHPEVQVWLDNMCIPYDEYRLRKPWDYDKSLEKDVDVLIDDRTELINFCVEKHKPLLLYNRPWNIKHKTPIPVTRILSLDGALVLLEYGLVVK